MRDLEFPMDTPANQLYTLNQVILYVYCSRGLIYELYCCYEFPHGWHHYFTTTDVYNLHFFNVTRVHLTSNLFEANRCSVLTASN